MELSSSPSMPMVDSHKSLGTSTILWEALKIPFRSFSLFTQILFLYLASSFLSLLFSGYNNSLYLALARPICSQVTDLTALTAFIEELSSLKLILLVSSFIISSLLTAATIHAIAMTYTGKDPTPSGVILKTKHSWKWSFVTQICINILHLGFIQSTDPVLVGFTIISHDSKVLVVLLVLVAILAALYYLYIAIVSLLCLVVSAIEDECFGITSIGRALKLISRSGKQGILINLLVLVLSSVASLVFRAAYSSHSSGGNELLIGFIHICTDVVINLVILATTTVLYYECKKRKNNVIELEAHLCL